MLDFYQAKKEILNKTELDEVDLAFDESALRVLAARYLLKDEKGMIIEGPKQMFERIAILVAISDILHDERLYDINGDFIKQQPISSTNVCEIPIGNYMLNKYHFEAFARLFNELSEGGHMKYDIVRLTEMLLKGEFDDYAILIQRYYDLMVSKDFLPNTPTLMNAGAPLGQLSACFVLDIQDDMEQIMNTAKDVAMIFKSGGGVGINYSSLRPEGDMVSSTSGVASGPISFMKVIDAVTGVVKQGGKRRGANMGIMNYNHPDIAKFINCKTTAGELENFNISVGTDAGFWEAVSEDRIYTLTNPRNGDVPGGLNATYILNQIAECAWKSAEPGLIFFDNINRLNPLITQKGPLNATNPCGEQSLYPYESCNLGSINLSNFVKDGQFEYERFDQVVKLCTRFLDNVIDVNKYPLERINTETKKTRRIGLGIMGLADALFKLDIAYNSEAGYTIMNRLAERLSWHSMQESSRLAKERGSYPLYNKDDFINHFPVAGAEGDEYWRYLKGLIAQYGIRNAWTTTIAPTGTLSMIAGCSSGVEPAFGLAFEKHVTVGKFSYTNEILKEKLDQFGLTSPQQIESIIANHGSCQGLDTIPESFQHVFVTAMDIHWADHIYAEAVWQKWISNAIAKTINMPGAATVADVKRAYLIAHELGLKGITVYRDGSRSAQVLHVAGDKAHTTAQPSAAVKKALSRLTVNEYVDEQISQVFDSLAEPTPVMAIAGGSVIPYQVFEQTCSCGAELARTDGCMSCKSCGFSACSVG